MEIEIINFISEGLIQSLFCSDPLFSYIVSGVKKITAIGYNKDNDKKFKLGVTVRIYQNGGCNFIDKILVKKVYFSSIEAYLNEYGYKTLLPNCDSFDEAVRSYEATRSKGEIQSVGIIALHLT